jgi:hypothetical protein
MKNTIEFENGKEYLLNIKDLLSSKKHSSEYFTEDEVIALAKNIKDEDLHKSIVFTYCNKRLVLLSGERLVHALNLLKRVTVSATFIGGYALSLALIENCLRSDLTAVELSESLLFLKEQKQCSNDALARLLHKSKSTVSEILKINKLPQDILDDARNKPEMTRERLLKIARNDKDEIMQKRMYADLCNELNSDKICEDNACKNLTIAKFLEKLNILTVDLKMSISGKIHKTRNKLSKNDKQSFIDAVEKLQKVVESM